MLSKKRQRNHRGTRLVTRTLEASYSNAMASELSPTRLDHLRILFEDDDLIAVDKPPGIPSQPTLDPRRFHMALAVELALRARGEASVYVGQHQRLDLDTSGVLLFTKAKRANKNLGEQFREHRLQKTYVALVASSRLQVGSQWEVRNHLAIESKSSGRLKSVRSGGDYAETKFEVLSTSERSSLIEARPRTGRRHQIRVHLAERGLPILGDATYARPGVRDLAPRLMLHARRLELQHPVTGAELVIEAPLPKDFLEVMSRFGL